MRYFCVRVYNRVEWDGDVKDVWIPCIFEITGTKFIHVFMFCYLTTFFFSLFYRSGGWQDDGHLHAARPTVVYICNDSN